MEHRNLEFATKENDPETAYLLEGGFCLEVFQLKGPAAEPALDSADRRFVPAK